MAELKVETYIILILLHFILKYIQLFISLSFPFKYFLNTLNKFESILFIILSSTTQIYYNIHKIWKIN